MDQASRQNRRKERRRLADLGRKALARGFSDNLDDEVSIGVATLICDKLSETGNAARATEAAAIAEQVLEKSNATYEKDPKVACRRGCSHCCVTVASVTPPEIFRVADWLRRNRLHDADMSPAAVIARAKAKAGTTLDEMFKQKVPCPALVDHACGVHPARPINCRQFLSTSVDACIESFGTGQGQVPYVAAATDRGVLARLLLTGAMKAAGLPDKSYELAGALAAALADDTAEQRWLAGEDVFAGVLVTPRPASAQTMIDRCASILAQSRN